MKQLKDALLINSYAGGILAGAMEAGVPIRGSYETSGYGLEIQRYNAPDLHFVDKTENWPKQDLSNTLVMGNPPCSAFSTLNTPMRQKNQESVTASIDSEAFKCTKDLLEYTMTNGAEMVMIESVPRAMTEAKVVHDAYAEKFDYSVIRVVQSASCYGLPQNRKRFWVIFAKDKGRTFNVGIPNPVHTTLKDVITQDGEPFADHIRQMKGYNDRMLEKYDEETCRSIWAGEKGYGKLQDVLKEFSGDEAWAKHVIANRWSVSSGSLLSPDKLAPVVLQCSLWFYNGKPLTIDDFFKIMGYPAWYRFPEAIAKRTDALGYLSRGICPPIAKWLIEEFATDLIEEYNFGKYEHRRDVKDGEILNLIDVQKEIANPAKVKTAKTKTDGTPRVKRSKEPVNYGVNPLAPKAKAVIINHEEAIAE